MTSVISSSENWLLVEWCSGGHSVVYVKSIVDPEDKEPEIGDSLTVYNNGEPEMATLIARANERESLESMIAKEEVAGPSKESKQENEEEDFSSSASSWSPSDDDVPSDDSDKVNHKKKILERYKRQYTNRSNKKVLTPMNKVIAVKTPRKKQNNGMIIEGNAVGPGTDESLAIRIKMAMDIKESAKDIFKTFRELFNNLEDMKKPIEVRIRENPDKYDFQRIVTPTRRSEVIGNQLSIQPAETADDDKENEHSEHEEFNRSDDNVLITNKHSNVGVPTDSPRASREEPNEEWVPIGSGKTLIHKDKFKKINWKSYTVATRSLLMAVFPRKVLATHSLTGKCSPAFMNKPAKMCLDPKKISDIILEIMDRYKMRENLVRSIITTKCADECKMWKTRNNKKNLINKSKQVNKTKDTNETSQPRDTIEAQ